MTPIRPLQSDDIHAVVALYAELDWLPAGRSTDGYREFFERALLEPPLADPELPALVYDDPEAGVVGVMGSHPRRYLFGERKIRLACTGPLIVHPDHRPRGLGALLMRRFLAGPQEMSFNDRLIEDTHQMWRMLGGSTDTGASIEWTRVLAPVGYAQKRLAERVTSRASPPAAAVAAAVDGVLGRRRRPPQPSSGGCEPLTSGDLIELIAQLRRKFPLRPDYSPEYLEAIFGLMGRTVIGDRVVRRLVRREDGRPIGAYVMIVARRGSANVVNVITPFESAGLVLEHLLHDAAEAEAVEVNGRVEAALLPHLPRLGCRLRRGDWAMVSSTDQELVNAALSGRSLISRMDGEWWMRPRPSSTPRSFLQQLRRS